MTKSIIIVLSGNAVDLAKEIAMVVHGEVWGLASRVSGVSNQFTHVGQFLSERFQRGHTIIAIMACGAVGRILAPFLSDKKTEPPVICVSEDGAHIVPLFGGHRGANHLASKIANAINATAAITTAGDLKFGIALDQPPTGYVLGNPEQAKSVMAGLINGARVNVKTQWDWLTHSDLPISRKGEFEIIISNRLDSLPKSGLVYHPRNLVLGMGCERGADCEEAIALAGKVLEMAGVTPQSLAMVASIDVKSDEPAVHAVGRHFGVPVKFESAKRLEEERSRLANPSEIVYSEVGCHGVAEGAALAAAGKDGTLLVEKIKSKRVTCALGEGQYPIDPASFGRARGRLSVVGIGPGSTGWRTQELLQWLEQATDFVGYSLYLDLVQDIVGYKKRHDFGLGDEEKRVIHALELADQGKNVALVCSGDAGIYAMATLVFELLDRGSLSLDLRRVEVAVSPGISAFQAAAARIGAPLGHDFCAISLSDLLTPWPDIQRRIQGAAEADFVIAFYNPVSNKRRTQLAWAREKLLEYRSGRTPVILATNLGRTGEKVRIVSLDQLSVDDVDMLTLVMVGSSNSRMTQTGDGKRWVYTPRGYAGKETSVIEAEELENSRKGVVG